jgi:hypothetical protein
VGQPDPFWAVIGTLIAVMVIALMFVFIVAFGF